MDGKIVSLKMFLYEWTSQFQPGFLSPALCATWWRDTWTSLPCLAALSLSCCPPSPPTSWSTRSWWSSARRRARRSCTATATGPDAQRWRWRLRVRVSGWAVSFIEWSHQSFQTVWMSFSVILKPVCGIPCNYSTFFKNVLMVYIFNSQMSSVCLSLFLSLQVGIKNV